MQVARVLLGERHTLIVQVDGAWLRTPFADLLDFFDSGEADLLSTVDSRAPSVTEELRPEEFLAPMSRFRRDILCTGWNYPNHFEESKGLRGDQEVDKPDHPTFFTKGPNTVIGPHQEIGIDLTFGDSWDYEAELALVIGKQGRSIRESEAMDHVWGFTLANDVSHRQLQRAHGGQWLKGKSLDRTMPLGPVIVSRDSITPEEIQIECELNGRIVQSASVAQMAFPIPRLIAELSQGMTLVPGDLLLTGTPAGVGNARTPQLFLHPGDVLKTRGSGIGEMVNTLASADLMNSNSDNANQDEIGETS